LEVEIRHEPKLDGVDQGRVMLAPSVVVLKNLESDGADSTPYIRIECRAP
jgi:hypothetical protein